MRQFPFQHAHPAGLVYGAGVSQKLGAQRPLKKAERILLLSDDGVVGAGLLNDIEPSLEGRVALRVVDVKPDGDVADIDALAAKAKEANVDAIVAIGGGSVMDTAKAVAVVVEKGGSFADWEGVATVRARLLPLVCVPTTAGTGSESTQFVVVQDRAAKTKRILTDQSVLPAMGVLDPSLITSLPERVTAATGIDALTHAVEACASKMAHPIGQAFAFEAARRIIVEGQLAATLKTPDDTEARGAMLSAATLAGMAISTSMLGACHAFAHALSAHSRVPHGVANGLFLATTMRFNRPKAQANYARLGQVLGGSGDESALCDFAIEAVERTVHEVANIPRKLSEVGVTEADLDAIAEGVLKDPDLATNPMKLADVATAKEMLAAQL